jgi:hypothetical protein
MVHHGDEPETRVVGCPGHGGQVGAHPGRPAGVGEVRDLQANLHVNDLS